ncbi:MAG: hypothetical protein RQ826_11035 [Xanthomonadales bacterium]|nr:hypothetical protein [Xanthomonadales bacterium]
MTGFSGSPQLAKGGIVVLDPARSMVQRVIPLQYNPESLNRSFQVQGAGGEDGALSAALRLRGPAVETLKLDAELDATDLLEVADESATELGIHRELAALESLLYPSTSALSANNEKARGGTLEIAPMESALTLFVWSKERILPVRITELSITEEAFSPSLNPLRAKVSLGMRVLSVDDVGFDHKGGSLFMTYLARKEQLRDRTAAVQLSRLGIGGIT